MSSSVEKKRPTYWILIAGLKGAGKTTFLKHISEHFTLRDRQDMSLITPEEEAQVLAWLSKTGGSLDPYRATLSADELLFQRWMRRMLVGEIDIDNEFTVCFYEAPGSKEFSFLGTIITPETYLGAITLIDSTAHDTIRDTSRLAATFAAYAPEPYVFAANKQDHPDAMNAEDIRVLLQFLDGHLLPVVPCVATDRHSAQRVLIQLLELIRDSYDDGISW